MKTCGIYTITNLINNKLYVGCTFDFNKRFKSHINRLKHNKHKNQYLQKAWIKYGEENFKFEVLVECEKEFLLSEEHYWCNLLNVHNPEFGYNIQPTNPYGNITPHKGYTHTQLSKDRISKAQKNKPGHRLGQKSSYETKLKLSLSHKGYKWKKEDIEKRETTRKNNKKPYPIAGLKIRADKLAIKYCSLEKREKIKQLILENKTQQVIMDTLHCGKSTIRKIKKQINDTTLNRKGI